MLHVFIPAMVMWTPYSLTPPPPPRALRFYADGLLIAGLVRYRARVYIRWLPLLHTFLTNHSLGVAHLSFVALPLQQHFSLTKRGSLAAAVSVSDL